MAIAGSLVVTVQAKTSDFEAGMRKVRTEVETTQKSVTSAQAGFQSLSTSLVGLTAGVLSVQALSSAMQDVVKVGIEMQNLRQSFAAISGGAQAGNREFQFVVQTANRLGLELQSVAGQYRSLSAATRGTALEGTATRELFTALSRAAQTYGLSTEQLGRALTAMQQIISKGKVSMEELRGQLGEALPGAMQIAARAFGTTTKGLEDMIAKGLDAAEFTRRFTAQLNTEVPTAAARAGAGFVQLGNEILLLKERAAQSGLLAFLDAAASKAAAVARALREGEEELRQRTERQAAPALGLQVTLDKLQADERQKLFDITEKLTRAEEELKGLQAARAQGSFGVLTPLIATGGSIAETEKRIDALRKERDELAKSATARVQTEQSVATRLKEVNEPYVRRKETLEATTKANAQLTTAYDAQKTAIDNLNKSSAAAPEIYGKLTGTIKEQILYLEKRKAITEKSLEGMTESIVARSAKAEPIPPNLVAQQDALRRQLREDIAGIEQRQQAIKDGAAAERKAIQETEAARRKAQQEKEAEQRLALQQAEEVARVHQQNIEALRTLAARYTSVRAERDADRASTLATSLAYSQHADEAKRLAQNIAEVQRIEEQLPALRSQAAGSAERLENITARMAEFEPHRRGETEAERLTRQYAELAQQPGVTMGVLSTASEKMQTQMQEMLDTEMWDKWEEVGLSALEHVSDAIEEFVFQGKFSFKDMMGAIAQDLFHFATQTLMQSATKKGGWLEMGLDLGLKALGIAAGGFGAQPTSGTLPTSWGQYNTMAAAGAFSGRQGGGPVMPGKFYTVGERGPELFMSRTGGTIIPNGQAGPGPTVINVNVHGVQDVQGLVQSKGAVSRAMYGALAQARQQL